MSRFTSFEMLDAHIVNQCIGCESESMATRKSTNRNDDTNERTTRKTPRGEDRERHPKLTLDVLGKEKEMSVRIDEHVTTIDSDYGTSELFNVTANGKMYAWFIRRRSGNFKILKRMFGRDPERWERKTVEVERQTFDSEDNGTVPFLAIVED